MTHREVVKQAGRRVMGLANVVGVGIGYKERQGAKTEPTSLVVLVTRKIPYMALAAGECVPEEIAGMPTDVIEVGELMALGSVAEPIKAQMEADQAGDAKTARDSDAAGSASPAGEVVAAGGASPAGNADDVGSAHPAHDVAARLREWRPLKPGVSIGHYRITAGTFGALVTDVKTGEQLILSNNHVMANCCGPGNPTARLGDPILQPGPLDGGTMDCTVANLLRYVPLKTYRMDVEPLWWPGPPPETEINRVDAAVARPNIGTPCDCEILGLGRLTGVADALPGTACAKSGRTTGVTRGEVRAIGCTITVGYPMAQAATFEDQIVCTCPSRGGDSGSLIVDELGRAIGLLFAGSDKATIASPASTVFDLLGVTV